MTYPVGNFIVKTERPDDYHCFCKYCAEFRGVILGNDEGVISTRKRVGYHWLEKRHIAKTPFPIAAWAVESFTREFEWVIDPTMGIGTTAVEAKKRGRRPVGIELNADWARIAALSCQLHGGRHSIKVGDVRDWARLLNYGPSNRFSLMVNNPPYSGDENQVIQTDQDGEVIERTDNMYEKDKRNLAFMKEGKSYYELLGEVYNGIGAYYMEKDSHLVIGVKDMVRNKKAYPLHMLIADKVNSEIWEFIGTWILPHYPRTLFMNTYPKRFPNVRIPLYQTIPVWRRK